MTSTDLILSLIVLFRQTLNDSQRVYACWGFILGKILESFLTKLFFFIEVMFIPFCIQVNNPFPL